MSVRGWLLDSPPRLIGLAWGFALACVGVARILRDITEHFEGEQS